VYHTITNIYKIDIMHDYNNINKSLRGGVRIGMRHISTRLKRLTSHIGGGNVACGTYVEEGVGTRRLRRNFGAD